MILQGSQRGGAKDLGQHLLKSDNEHVTVHDLRGFVADDLVPALNEIYAVSRGTKAKQYLFSVSLNPPPSERVSTQDFEEAISRIEKEFGLQDQPRAVVFHEKDGRRHCHAVWSRIHMHSMTAIQLSYTKLRFKEISRELYIKHGWEMPQGFQNRENRNPLNFTLAQWQQAKRVGKSPKQIKAALQDCWSISDSQAAFQAALKDRGFTLARGDRRGFVVLDHKLEVYSVPKWVGVKAKDVRAKLQHPEKLPSVEAAKAQISEQMNAHLRSLKAEHIQAVEERIGMLESQKQNLIAMHKQERAALVEQHEARWYREVRERQARYNKGLRGLLDRVTGRRKKIKTQNEIETFNAAKRDRAELDGLIYRQLETRQKLAVRERRLEKFSKQRTVAIDADIALYPTAHRSTKEHDAQIQPPLIGPER